MIMKTEKFKHIFEGLKIAYGQYQKGERSENGSKQKGKAFIVRKNVSDDLWENHLQGKVRLSASSLFVRITRVAGAVLILTVTISTTAASFKAYEILISP